MARIVCHSEWSENRVHGEGDEPYHEVGPWARFRSRSAQKAQHPSLLLNGDVERVCHLAVLQHT